MTASVTFSPRYASASVFSFCRIMAEISSGVKSLSRAGTCTTTRSSLPALTWYGTIFRSDSTSANLRPMKRLMEYAVFSGLTAACRRASVPTSLSPDFVKATTDGVVREPSAFGMTTGSPPSMTAMTELVVPRSIPTVFGICLLFLPRPEGAYFNSQLLFFFPMPWASKQLPGRLWEMPIFELDPTEHIAVAAVGQPGRRQFFLLASGAGRTLTLSCEKSQIHALIVRLQQMIATQGIEAVPPTARASRLPPGSPPWQGRGSRRR